MLIWGGIVALALVAGVAGTWSPCGLSSIETLVASEAGGDRRRTRATALAMFCLGTIAGGVVVFGGLSLIGSATLGATSWALAALLALAGVADAMGLPVVPRIARQVPEAWRRRHPLPVVGLLYGGLLGLGLTTFVMSYGLWAALVAMILLGDPLLGVLAGVAFGLGRALPVVLLAGWWERGWADRALDTMLGRPATLRFARAVGAVVALAAAAAAMPVATASATTIPRAFSPSLDAGAVAFSRTEGSVLVRPGLPPEALPGARASIGGGRIAWVVGELVTIVDGADRSIVAELAVPGVDAVAIHGDWVAMRRTIGRRSVLEVRTLAEVDAVRRVVAGQAGALSRPSIHGDTLLVARSGTSGSSLLAASLPDGRVRTVRRARPGVELRGASLGPGRRITWVEADSCRQRVLAGPLVGRSQTTVASWRSTAERDGGFEAGFVNAFNRASLCPGGIRGGKGRLRIIEVVRDEVATYVSAVPKSGGQPRIVVLPRVSSTR